MPGLDVTTEILFLERSDTFDTEKPYTLQYEPDPGFLRTNCNRVPTSGINITDIRGKEHEYTKEKHGFEILQMESKLSRDEFFDNATVQKTYYEELEELLKRKYGAKRVEILEHSIRQRHPSFPAATGKDYDFGQPAALAHIDLSLQSSLQVCRRVFDIEIEGDARLETVNVWKPLRGPLMDWPLAVCDANTVDPETDLIPCDVVAREGYGENLQVFHNPRFRWHYLSKQLASEIIVFRQADTREETSTGVPHASFFNPLAESTELPRESVEVRAFLFY